MGPGNREKTVLSIDDRYRRAAESMGVQSSSNCCDHAPLPPLGIPVPHPSGQQFVTEGSPNSAQGSYEVLEIGASVVLKST